MADSGGVAVRWSTGLALATMGAVLALAGCSEYPVTPAVAPTAVKTEPARAGLLYGEVSTWMQKTADGRMIPCVGWGTGSGAAMSCDWTYVEEPK